MGGSHAVQRGGGFNPIGYHLGTVWPHDNGLIAEGFRRYRRHEEAERIVALVEAAMDFPQQRLPECFAGYARAEFGTPVRYPVACHPQAWAAGATPHLLTTSLGLAPKRSTAGSASSVPGCPVPRARGGARPSCRGRNRQSGVRGSGGQTTASIQDLTGDLDVRIEYAGQ